ncbi:MAG: MFS transporter, partial [Chloroflexota bacterium]|nr:MFS transporter [Chloroflexota bacterium]
MDPTLMDLPGSPRSEAPPAGPVPQAARLAVTAIFAVNGLILSNWVPRIPAVQRNLDLSEGRLGLALLGVAVGALLAMPLIGGLVARFGSRPATTVAVVALAATVPLPALAGGLGTLTLALVLLGAANGALDVAMNAQAVAVERRFGHPIMSSFHAAFSFGGLAGAILGGLAAAAGIDPLPHLAVVGVVGAGLGITAARGLLPAAADARRETPTGTGPTFARPSRRLVGLGILAFCCLLGEGAMADWSAVYLDGSLGTGPGLAAAGFASFSLTMAFGRLIGDRLAARWGPVALARCGGVLVAVSLALALLIEHPAAAIIG